jgi:hypothetical protein
MRRELNNQAGHGPRSIAVVLLMIDTAPSPVA